MLATCIQYVFGRFRWVTRAVTIVVVFFTLTNRALYSVIYVVATPAQYMVYWTGQYQRSISGESYNESMKTKQRQGNNRRRVL